MAAFHLLSDKQKNLLRVIVPGLKDGTIPTQWHIMEDRGQIVGIKGFYRNKDWERVWNGNIEPVDLTVFEKCGFIERIEPNSVQFNVFAQAIIDAVENNFGERTSMPPCALSDRQKELLRSIVPGLKDGTVGTEWNIMTGDDRIMVIFGLDAGGNLWREVWADKVKFADFDDFVQCGLFRDKSTSSSNLRYTLNAQAIINFVEAEFDQSPKKYAVTSGKQITVTPDVGNLLRPNREWPQIFVLMPFSDQMKPIYKDHIVTVSEQLNLTCKRADDFFSSKPIIDEIWSALYYCEICIVDCTGRNPNVFYELGIAHTLGKPCVLITQSFNDIPFDLKHRRIIEYEYTPPGMKEFEVKLLKTIQQIKLESVSSPKTSM